MSFFSGFKLTVYSAILPLMEETEEPFSDLVLYSVLQNQNITDVYLNAGVFNKKNINTKAYYNYAKNSYYLGLPEGTTGYISGVSRTVIKETIETEIGKTILLGYSITTTLTATLAILPFLYADRQLDVNTGEIFNPPPGIPPVLGALPVNVYLNSVDPSEDATTAFVEYYLVYLDGSSLPTIFKYFIEEVPLDPASSLGDIYTVANYYADDSPTVLQWWYYNIESGVYPELSLIYDTVHESNSFMPVIPIRYDNVDLCTGSHLDTDLYKTSRELLRKVGIDISSIADALNDNPDIDEIDHAYVTHGIEPTTDHVPSLYYLGIFFDDLAASAELTKWTYTEAKRNGTYAGYNDYAFIDPDLRRQAGGVNLLEHNLNVSISFSYIDTKTVRGSIGKVEHATQEYFVVDVPVPGGWGETMKETHYVLRYQYAEYYYREIDIVNLTYRNQIYHNAAYVLTPDEAGFFIPIHYGLCSTLPQLYQDEIYFKTLSIVINTFNKDRIPWYSQGWFLVVKIIVAVILTAFTSQGWQLLLAEAVEAGFMAVVMFFATNIVIMVAVNVAFKYLAEMLGPEYAGLFAVIALVASAVSAYANVGGSLLGMTTAQTLLRASMSMLSATGQVIQDQIQDVAKELSDFKSEAQDQIDKIYKLLEDLEAPLDVMELISSRAGLGTLQETPSQFYFRTVHSGNIGVAVYDTVKNYHTYALNAHKSTYLSSGATAINI